MKGKQESVKGKQERVKGKVEASVIKRKITPFYYWKKSRGCLWLPCIAPFGKGGCMIVAETSV